MIITTEQAYQKVVSCNIDFIVKRFNRFFIYRWYGNKEQHPIMYHFYGIGFIKKS